MTAYNGLSDLELVASLQDGDQAAFAEIYDRYFGVLYVHAFKRLKDEDEAKDLVQELFAGLWSKRTELFLKTNLSNYLYTSVRNRVINTIAHKDVASRYIAELPHQIATENCITDYRLRERQLAAIIEQEIQALPPRMREVFQLSRKANLTYKEIAEELGLSEQSVRSHVKNALKILRTRLGVVIYLMWLIYM
ncbi:RNA polymerase sigma-70 factor (plasmid) [Pedobacter sp. BS3]|uniref:RNA polymerase sigma factor n=1 Tax=Pedobacter sp. BS3 TaxID=2567937 RepID=UPI0011EEACF0|nr:RNA polymerase sigma-70 factor [Pedobacter sp. BS3]TZF86302.1 RNA polymerase sigma-70 factor [Pedobacter sp. BS3]